MLRPMTEQTGEGRTASEATDSGPVDVVDNPALARFELSTGGRVVGIASYALVAGDTGAPGTSSASAGGTSEAGGRIVFFHTEVLPEFEGRGLAAQLAAYALDEAVASGRDIVALCPYIKEYVHRHPEPYAAHVVAAKQADVAAARQAAAAAE